MFELRETKLFQFCGRDGGPNTRCGIHIDNDEEVADSEGEFSIDMWNSM